MGKSSFAKAAATFLMLFICQASSPLDILAADDLLDAVLEAHRTACEKIESAKGTGTFESYRQAAGEKEMKLLTKAKVDVQFGEGKYNLHFDYETQLQLFVYKNADGTETKKVVDAKPENFFVLHDGTTWTEVKFSKGITPAGCAGEIRPGHFRPTFRWSDVAQMSKCISPDGYLKNLGRDKLTVTDLPSGIRRISGWVKDSTKVRFELDADPKVGFNITAERGYNEPNKEPAHTKEITWKKKGEVWYGEQIIEIAHLSKSDGTSDGSRRDVFKFDSFEPNVEVAPAIFTLAATGVPKGARFHDRRPGAPNRLLYYDGAVLSPERPVR